MQNFILSRPAHAPPTDLGLLVLRVVAGLALAVLHGAGKFPPPDWFVGAVGQMGLPAPGLFAWLGAIAELGGGILLAIGLLTRPVAIFVFFHFLFVIFMAHAGDPFGDRELAILFAAVVFLFAAAGPGRYSVDAALFRRQD